MHRHLAPSEGISWMDGRTVLKDLKTKKTDNYFYG